MPNYRLTIEYEGTRYSGWQEQQNARTVAGEIRRAVERVAGRIEDLGGAGRTDAGVHAAAQTAHLRLTRTMDPEALRFAVNDLLPPDIHLLSVVSAPAGFHARHSALSRSYLYQVAVRRTAYAKRFVWWVKRPLDPLPMREAASLIEGRHDFALFCERPTEQTSTLVVVEAANIAPAGGLLLIRLVASHFLWRMVRRLVGTLVEVGSGQLSVEAFHALLLSTESAKAGSHAPAQWTAPPSGLFLERVIYPGDQSLQEIAPIIPVPAEPPPESGGSSPRPAENLRQRASRARSRPTWSARRR